MDIRALVGRNVRRARIEQGLTQEELADRANTSQFYISSLEAGRRNPTVETVHALAIALGLSDWLTLLRPDGERAGGA
ncbi:transcriptional regulator with XRE-family HTH domain [Brevundimonas vesicularis]|jgi:transcriptional regulator with XRE-family HTH domain|uniref:Transcriptional regulator with XRE-family HTH domain n=1 Tax=Brevundimonas vesicularis TaxID=41276 RepID=A0A7W9L655_BREVE|nr:helix-turn-helix transcriptional regulator [Brevundimonas vesicularis]MBB5772091.1 transcriptional regulator with XRE-family HTH domain [Brevundimonas vesicularis]